MDTIANGRMFMMLRQLPNPPATRAAFSHSAPARQRIAARLPAPRPGRLAIALRAAVLLGIAGAALVLAGMGHDFEAAAPIAHYSPATAAAMTAEAHRKTVFDERREQWQRAHEQRSQRLAEQSKSRDSVRPR